MLANISIVVCLSSSAIHQQVQWHDMKGVFAAAALGAIISSTAMWYFSTRPIFNEVVPSKESKTTDNLAHKKSDTDTLYSLIWGSNKYTLVI